MLRRIRNVGIIKDGRGNLSLSKSFLSQLETAFQRFQRGTKERKTFYETHEHKKTRPTARKLLPGIMPMPFYRVRIGRFVLPAARQNRMISLPKNVVKEFGLSKRKTVTVTVDDQGESIAIPTSFRRTIKKGAIITNTSSTSYSLGFKPLDTLDPDGVFISCKNFVQRKYAQQRAMFIRNASFHSMYFIRIVFAAKAKNDAPRYYIVSTPVFHLYENGKATIIKAIDAMRQLFYDTIVKLEDYQEYDSFYVAGVTYYTHDLYKKGRPIVMR